MPRLKQPRINFVSLCKQGRSLLATIKKSTKAPSEYQFSLPVRIAKSSPQALKQGRMLGAIGVPKRMDIDGDWLEQEDLDQVLETFVKSGTNLDVEHDEKPLARDSVWPRQYFEIQAGDPRFQGLTDDKGEVVDYTGGIALEVQIDDADLRAQAEAGEINAFSIGGVALKVVEDPSTEQSLLKDLMARLAKSLDPPKKENPNMDEARLAALIAAALKSSNEELLEGIKKAVTPQTPTPPKDEAFDPMVFIGNPMNPLDVRRHQMKLAKAVQAEELLVDWSDPDAVKEHLESLGGSNIRKSNRSRQRDPFNEFGGKDQQTQERPLTKSVSDFDLFDQEFGKADSALDSVFGKREGNLN